MDKQADEFRRFIEIEVLKIIKQLAQDSETTQDEIEAIAQTTLDLIQPGMTIEELYANAVKLDDQHTQLAPVVRSIMNAYETHFEHKAIDHVSGLIKSGKYDDAQNMVKKVLEFKIAG